jgi:copper chaperone CopZ
VNELKKTKLNVSGMHCKSCEVLVKDELEEIPGVTEAEANHKDGFVLVSHEDSAKLDEVKARIIKLGYKVKL